MSLREKHLSDQNRMAKLMSMAIVASMLLIILLSFINGIKPALIIRAAILIVSLIVNFIGCRILRTSELYRHVVSISTFVAYLAFILSYNNIYVYAFIFPIAVMIMTFQDRKVITIAAVLAVLTDLFFFVSYKILFPDQVSVDIIIVQMVLVVVSAVTSVFIIIMQQKHALENTQEIEERAARQAQVAAEVVKHSKELAERFQQAMTVSDTLNECMDSSHTSVSEIADSTRLTAEAIEQQTTQTMEIQHHVQKVEEQTRQMAQLSEATKATVEEGVELIGELKEQATEVAKISHATEETTKNLNASIKEVEAITATILGISSQTNLLALNASIEAARAGEAGKGFAVVADEIRNLSEGTKEATEQISAIIGRLINDAEEASVSMSRSADYAEKQNEMISVTGDKLLDIQKNSDALNGNVMRVTQAVEDVVVANTAISDSISNLSATSEEVAASTESSLALSDSSMNALKEMNELLNEIYEISENMMQLSE
ncbi:MAG: methyl-accepting chemotaxis protein [bacterium]|nr:methyl-accepting chemotaxis protein [bacterium]MDY4098796.1 methyl-accepting chemotaxis protein [Lachnospiraceae bacterium]